jgi:hypothetical protein
VADVFAVPLSRIRITATRTDKVPNTSATAASSGSISTAWRPIMRRSKSATGWRNSWPRKTGWRRDVRFTPEGVVAGDAVLPFRLWRAWPIWAGSNCGPAVLCHARHPYDRAAHQGRPFYYFAYGAACSEVVIDTLTGEHKVLRTDILHDAGRSLNPAIDLGQVEGGFIQGMGWLTTRNWCSTRRAPDPRAQHVQDPDRGDRPARMDIRLWDRGENVEPTIHRSKAVGEPPFMLAISVFSALSEAVMAVRPVWPARAGRTRHARAWAPLQSFRRDERVAEFRPQRDCPRTRGTGQRSGHRRVGAARGRCAHGGYGGRDGGHDRRRRLEYQLVAQARAILAIRRAAGGCRIIRWGLCWANAAAGGCGCWSSIWRMRLVCAPTRPVLGDAKVERAPDGPWPVAALSARGPCPRPGQPLPSRRICRACRFCCLARGMWGGRWPADRWPALSHGWYDSRPNRTPPAW